MEHPAGLLLMGRLLSIRCMLIAITMTKYNKKSENNKRAHKVKIKRKEK
jgi:hypothetical protein